MSGARVAVIVNPVAGTRGGGDATRRRIALVSTLLARDGQTGDVHVTEGPGDADTLVRDNVTRGATLVIAWGGDGTVNAVASVLAFGPVALGIVPAGSGNGLARELGLPRDPAAALRVALRGADRAIDAGELGGRLFFNAAGVGFDAHVAARFNARGRARRGLLAYVALTTRDLFRYQARDYALIVDDERWQGRALVVACVNSRQYGGGAIVAPQARIDDGRLDLVVACDRRRLAVLWESPRLFTGTLDRAAGILTRPFKALEIRAGAPLAFHVDGEPHQGEATLTARVHPGALRVRVPRPVDAAR